MKIVNKTKHTTLATNASFARGFTDKSIGLIGADEPKALMFQTRFGIHTFGVRFAIDILILNDIYEVVALKRGLKPNCIYFWNPKYKTVIELPEGTVDKTKTTICDVVQYSS